MSRGSAIRRHIFRSYGLIALAIILLHAGAVVVAVYRGLSGAGLEALILALFVTGLGSLGATVWAWLRMDEGCARPLDRLAGDLESAAHAAPGETLPAPEPTGLGRIDAAAGALVTAFHVTRSETDEKVRAATDRAEVQKARLETVLRELHEGVVICRLDGRILLYNREAQRLLQDAGEIGLGRALPDMLVSAPLVHAVDRLQRRFEEDRHKTHTDGLSTGFVTTTRDGLHTLHGRAALTLDATGARSLGFVASFRDVTDTIGAHADRDQLIMDVLQAIRRRAAALWLNVEMLEAFGDMTPEEQTAFRQSMEADCTALSGAVEALAEGRKAYGAAAWSASDILCGTLFADVQRRTPETLGLIVAEPARNIGVHCDSYLMAEALAHLLRRVAEQAGVSMIEASARRVTDGAEERVYLDFFWDGTQPSVQSVAAVLSEPLGDDLKGMTAAAALAQHQTECWPATAEDGRAMLRLPLPVAVATPARMARAPVPERPQFYDFDLFDRPLAAAIQDQPLDRITAVVFDTETTGLEPSRGDEIVQIAGVRIVNGRVVAGETFDRLVNPGRSIPRASSEIHGITEGMVAETPGIEIILPRFHAFAAESVLVAHNAAFDMKFLRKNEHRTGAVFDNPVLDTVLLAAHLFGNTADLTLDALARRFNVTIPKEARHTALGDSIATAQVFLSLVAMLKTRGVVTVRDAFTVSETIDHIRRKQARY